MQNDAAMLHCPNELCKAPNSQTDKFCQQCGTLLSKRYLWAIAGEGIEAYKIGDIVADRYLLKSHRIFLDTKPGLVTANSDLEISDQIKPYLRLVRYRLQIPQVYGLLPTEDGRTSAETWLLEQAPIWGDGMQFEGQLMPELTVDWKQANSMRQLNWLWQIAQLWQPLSSEKVASSLLEPSVLRVEKSLVRLLECIEDYPDAPTLASLGQLWQTQLAPFAQPPIAIFVEQLCQSLIVGEVRSSEELVTLLDRGLAEVGRSQVHTIKIATRTDRGPSRQRNEDACYPPSGSINIFKFSSSLQSESIESTNQNALTIVCDGIGGHEGGNVASNLAIETIQQQIQQMPLDDAVDTTTLSSELERSTCAANDRISQRNDNENRYGRQRMGTTLVMALARLHEVYITHVGDSRVYWITRTGCHQVTLDDDVASREVRLGYALYRDALQQASSGSLVQALGMNSLIHPTVQRFILDEDCVFLLCSDGLSDNERVEEYWETDILPILEGKVDVATASQKLVEIANTQNGHDNVTVALVYCQVSFSEPKSEAIVELLDVPHNVYPASQDTDTQEISAASPSTLKTQFIQSQSAQQRYFLPVLLGLLLLLGLGTWLAYLLIPQVSGWVNRQLDINPNLSPELPPKAQSPSPVATPTTSIRLNEGSLIEIQKNINLGERGNNQTPSKLAPNQEPSIFRLKGSVPAGSILKVVDSSQQDDFLKLRICSTPPSTGNLDTAKPTASNLNQDDTQMKKGEEGWIRQITLDNGILKNGVPSQLDGCPATTSLNKPVTN